MVVGSWADISSSAADATLTSTINANLQVLYIKIYYSAVTTGIQLAQIPTQAAVQYIYMIYAQHAVPPSLHTPDYPIGKICNYSHPTLSIYIYPFHLLHTT